MHTSQVRQVFLDFFAHKGHKIVPSAPLVNRDDPTLLFVNAGMNPFKDVFLGLRMPQAPRIADTQKCLRVSGKHNDLEEVGHDTYHHTFFEMLGNWSFGDYFKEEAIAYAWELLTQVYRIPAERLYATVFGGDEALGLPKDVETYQLWQRYLPKERIHFFGKKDNFWEMGDVGPCGPCTEIHIDLRDNPHNAASLLNQGNPLVIELWNLVFIQYNRRTDGNLESLPLKSVDTGMGLERLAMVLQGVKSTYDIDLFRALQESLMQITHIPYGKESLTDVAIRVVCDHIRALGFAIADGQLPSNVGAGYVIRRLLRRALRYGYQRLGQRRPFLYKLIPTLAHVYEGVFPELATQKAFLMQVIEGEEESFLSTLERGLSRFENYLAQNPHLTQVPGEVVFELYDTYGFPVDLTQLLARERGLSVEIEGYERALAAQKVRSRKATHKQAGDWIVITEGETHSEFVGYDQYDIRTCITQMRKVHTAKGELYQIVLQATPFYPESGGQIGDTGILRRGDEIISVQDTQKEQNTIIHYVTHLPHHPEGEWQATIDIARRLQIAAHHTATHLLHAALREVLGTHVRQSGSWVGSTKLRFDFSHPQRLTPQQLQEVEDIVNEKISQALPLVEHRNILYQKAVEMGALAFFGEKYGEVVRVIEFGGGFSRELCGGTHARNTSELRFFKILHESASSAGVRRIEAITAKAFAHWVKEMENQIAHAQTLLGKPPKWLEKLEKTLAHYKTLQNEANSWKHAYLEKVAHELLHHPLQEEFYTVTLPSAEVLRDLLFLLRQKAPDRVIKVRTGSHGYMYVGVAAPTGASEILRSYLEPYGGKGGGQATWAIGSFPIVKNPSA
ncbi:MAG: alanine--tRNA ligase [Bacteroidia bacterium]